MPLWLWGALADLAGLRAATKLIVWASLMLGLLGSCAVLRAQGKPVVLALLSMPFVYASAFYLGLVPCMLSMSLALWAIAWLLRGQTLCLAAVSCIIPLTHPAGMIGVLLFAACHVLAHGRSWRQAVAPLWPLTPLALGAVFWLNASLHADGVAGPHWPGLVTRIMRAPRLLLGGWNGEGDAWLLAAASVVWLYLCRPMSPRESLGTLASWCFAALLFLAYFLLPGSTGSSSAICERAGGALLLWLPMLVPNIGLTAARQRGPLLLVALAASTCWYTSTHLIAFNDEAQHFDAVLAKMPARPKLWTLAYDSQGALACSNPYVHIAAYAQAERGGFLSLSHVDYAWAIPFAAKTLPLPRQCTARSGIRTSCKHSSTCTASTTTS
ncbi:MAG TPA: hypothetical protein VFN67_29350 [Polyangiales bacterium]|nr:hypothetical protein [Polyangiales bacterium]